MALILVVYLLRRFVANFSVPVILVEIHEAVSKPVTESFKC